MMAPAHALTGVAAGLVLAAATAHPWPVQAATVAVTAGAALLPDLDHRGATVSRSLGPITKVLSRMIAALSRAVYRATRSPGDRKTAGSGHRQLTHTVPGCVGLAAIVAAVTACGRWPGLVILGLLVALGAAGVPALGAAFTLSVTLLLVARVPDVAGYWWLWGTATAVGCGMHLLGDAATVSGIPALWPLERGGRRWADIRLPVTTRAGSAVERMLVVPALLCGCGWGAWLVFGGGPTA